jgi:hypothetical protein
MSSYRFSRRARFVVCAALLAAGFAGCSGSGEQDSPERANAPSEVNEPNSDDSVAGVPICVPGCFRDEEACLDALEREPEPGCFCTIEPSCCGRDQFALLCEP